MLHPERFFHMVCRPQECHLAGAGGWPSLARFLTVLHAWRTGHSQALGLCAALVIAVQALYAQTASFEFLTLDDYNFLLTRRTVRAGLSWPGLRWAMLTVEPNWHPVTWLTHQLDFTLFGPHAGPHHLVSAALHSANALLCFLALRALTGALWPSALVAALFALHPLRAESVAWLSERKDVTSGLFWMLTLLAYAGYVRRPTVGRYALVFGALMLGLMSKTMLVSLPLVLLLLDVWPLGRWPWAAAGARPVPVAWLVTEKLPLVGLALAASVITIFAQQAVGGVRSLGQVPMAWRLVNAPIAYATYLAQTAWPVNLAAIYPHPATMGGAALRVWPAIGAGALLVAITAFCLAAIKRAPYLAVGWFWYLIALVPVIGLFQVGRQAHADRYTYLPTIGIYAMLAWGLRDAAVRRPALRVPAVAASAAALVVLAALSWRQIGTWRNTRVLFEHAIAVTEDNYYAHQALGAALSAAGEFEAARRHLEEALRISPDSAYAVEQLGLLRERQGDRVGAAAAYERALALSWKSFFARRNLAAMRRAEGNLDAAIELWTAAVEYQPDDAQLRFDLGSTLLQRERYADAAAHLRRAAALRPDFAQAHNNLGVALAKQGLYAEALSEFERVLALNPNHPTAARSLRWVRAQLSAESGAR